jgi:alpha-L-rhamnosidase
VGCQYVEATGAVPAGHPNPHGLPVIKQLVLVHTRAANRSVGTFSCSSPVQNAAHGLIDWAIRSNMSYVATDCPHREKNGWQEQNWHMARALSYRYDIRDWFGKISHDLRDTQLPDGHIPTNCPNYLVGVPPHGFWNEAPEWGVAGVFVPWHLYEWYGDRAALAASFESMNRYVDYLATQAQDGIIRSNLGDWYDYGHGQGDGPAQWTPSEVSATAIWAGATATVARAAQVLGRAEDAARYQAAFETIRRDFQRHFYDAASKMVRHNGSCQAGNATALCLGLVPEADRPAVAQAIVDDLERRAWQQTTGEVLHVFLIRALAEAGRGDVLHKVYSREERGSYGFMVRNGLTTLPESWDAKPGTGNSLNHFMLGHLVEWHFAYVAGIRQQPGSVGWRKILIAPDPGPLESAEASFDGPTGTVASRWRRAGGRFELTVEVPAGVEALAVLPDGTRHDLPAGSTTLHCADR